MRPETQGAPAHSAAVHGRAAEVADLAGQALVMEFMLTPKPGLVDQRNSGAHSDMDLALFRRSAVAISGWFATFAGLGLILGGSMPDRDILRAVRAEGLRCEAAMFQATGGVNTHKGAIFSLGLLCSAAGLLLAEGGTIARETICARVAGLTAGIVERELGHGLGTAGERAFHRHGLQGARGEASRGFPTVRGTALPVYDGLMASGLDERTVLLQVLLNLLAVNGDTNLVTRGGLAGLAYVQGRATDLLRDGGVVSPDGLARLLELDDDLIARRLSPSGSADLIAVTWLLARLAPAGHGAVAPASVPGSMDGSVKVIGQAKATGAARARSSWGS